MPDAMPAVLKNGGVLIEPWTFMDMADRTAAERAKAVLQSPRIFPDSAKMGSAPLTVAEELEITFQWMLWMVACVLPLLSLAWLLVWPSLAAGAVAAAVAVSMLWRSGEWPVPPPRRLQCIVRNRKIASVFMRYHPLRLIVEAPEELLSESGSRTTRLFAGGARQCGFAPPTLGSRRPPLLPPLRIAANAPPWIVLSLPQCPTASSRSDSYSSAFATSACRGGACVLPRRV